MLVTFGSRRGVFKGIKEEMQEAASLTPLLYGAMDHDVALPRRERLMSFHMRQAMRLSENLR